MREERLKRKSEGGSEVLSWIQKSRKLEEKRNAEREKALHLSKIFEEQVGNLSCSTSFCCISLLTLRGQNRFVLLVFF